jgi:hypothetical protein
MAPPKLQVMAEAATSAAPTTRFVSRPIDPSRVSRVVYRLGEGATIAAAAKRPFAFGARRLDS